MARRCGYAVDDGWRAVGIDEDCPTGALRIQLSAEVIGLVTNVGIAPGAALDFAASLVEPGQRWSTTAQLTASGAGLSPLTLTGRSTEAIVFVVILSSEGPNIESAIQSLVQLLGALIFEVKYKANAGWRGRIRRLQIALSIPSGHVAGALAAWATAHGVSSND